MVQRTVSSAQYLEKMRQRRANRRAKKTNTDSKFVQPPSTQDTNSKPNLNSKQFQQNNNTASRNNHQAKFKQNLNPEHTMANQANFQTKQSNEANTDQEINNPYLPADYKIQESQIAPGMMKPLPEEEILAWQAASRPFKKHNRKFFTTIAVISLLVSLIFFFAGQGLLPVAVAASVTFLVYVLFTIPPQEVTNKITTYGIRIENSLYYWEELGRFWFDEKYDQKILYIETGRFPGRITLLLGKQNQDYLKSILAEVLLNKKPEPTFFEKAGDWLSKKIPLDFD